jgi:hypothetical protein
MTKAWGKVTQIQILKKPNWFGRLGLKIVYFGGWLYDITGNTFTKEDYKEVIKRRQHDSH